MGIRIGVWLMAFCLLSVCVVLVTIFSPAGDQPTNEIVSAPPSQLPGSLSKRFAAGSSSAGQRTSLDWLSAHDLLPPAPRDAEEAARLASFVANQQARELFDCEPFSHERPARVIDGRWVWSDSRGQGKADLEATVEFTADGTVQSVHVLLLDSSPDLFRF